MSSSVVRDLRRRTLRAVVGLLLHVVPSRRGVLVGLGLDDEDNGLVMAARLADDGALGPVVVSCADPVTVRRRLDSVADALDLDASGVRLVRRQTLGDLWTFVRARLVLYTHGMYASPAVRGRRRHVNLWHGTGPKWLDHGNFVQFMGASHVVTAARTWGLETARALHMSPRTELLHGNPRADLLSAPPDRSALAAWGLDPARPMVLWMPTFRATGVMAEKGTVEGRPVASSLTTDPLMLHLLDASRRRGIQLVVKTHPYDTDAWDTLPITRLTSEDLWREGLSIYRFLALADGLLSDYSSVWVDYLRRDRPIALYCPDLDDYAADRGLNEPSMAQVAGELLLQGAPDVDAFLDDVERPNPRVARTLADVRAALEHVPVTPWPSLVLRDQLVALLGESAPSRSPRP